MYRETVSAAEGVPERKTIVGEDRVCAPMVAVNVKGSL